MDVGKPDGLLDLLGGDDTAVAVDLIGLHARERGESAGLVVGQVRAPFHNNFVAWPGVCCQCGLVGHSAGRHE